VKELTIEPKTEGKGRSFRALMVSYVEARDFMSRGNDAARPILMVLAGTDNELRPFVANLRTGKKAEGGYRGRDKYEVLKSSGFQVAWQRTPKGCVATIFAPDVFALDPGMVDPAGVKFCLLPAKRWLVPSTVDVPACVPDDRIDDVRQLAPLFIAYLDRRTRCPLIPDPRFYAQVLGNALDEGLAEFGGNGRQWNRGWAQSSTFETYELEAAGFGPALWFHSTHDRLEKFLAEQVAIYFGAEAKAAA
jgi:hypothetical protein